MLRQLEMEAVAVKKQEMAAMSRAKELEEALAVQESKVSALDWSSDQ